MEHIALVRAWQYSVGMVSLDYNAVCVWRIPHTPKLPSFSSFSRFHFRHHHHHQLVESMYEVEWFASMRQNQEDGGGNTRYEDDKLQMVVPEVVGPSEELASTSQRTFDLVMWVEWPSLVELMVEEETMAPNLMADANNSLRSLMES